MLKAGLAENPQLLEAVPNFTVGHEYGKVMWIGEIDIRGVNLDDIVQIDKGTWWGSGGKGGLGNEVLTACLFACLFVGLPARWFAHLVCPFDFLSTRFGQVALAFPLLSIDAFADAAKSLLYV